MSHAGNAGQGGEPGLSAHGLGVIAIAGAVQLLMAVPAAAEGPAVISFAAPTLYPESVSWSQARKRFFVGSVRHGQIGTVDAKGRYRVFADDPSLVSTFGIRVDDTHRHLWVTIADFGISDRSMPGTQNKLAAVALYDSVSGERLGYHDLTELGPGARLGNDVAVDPAGNAYVADSFAQVIYRIDPAGRLTVFADSPILKTGESIGLDGIAYHPDGYLLVGAWNSGEILRVAMADPTKIDKVAGFGPIKGMDGIALLDATHVVAAVNVGEPRIVELESGDGWASARVVATKPAASTFPSSVTIRGNDAWVLNARIDNLLDQKAAKVDQFMIQNAGLSQAR